MDSLEDKFLNTQPEIAETAHYIKINLLTIKSREKDECKYDIFSVLWLNKINLSIISKHIYILLACFSVKAKL